MICYSYPKDSGSQRFSFFYNSSTLITQTLWIIITFFHAMQPALDYPLEILMYLFTHWKLFISIAAWSWSNCETHLPRCLWHTKSAFEIFGLNFTPSQPDPNRVTIETWEVWTKKGYRSLWRVKHYESGWMDWCLVCFKNTVDHI